MAQHLATPTDAPEHAPVPAFDIVAELNGVVLHPDSTRFDRYVALNALHRIALDINARRDFDSDQRHRAHARHQADYQRARRKLDACARLIRRTGRVDLTEAEILAEVVAFDHAEACAVGGAA